MLDDVTLAMTSGTVQGTECQEPGYFDVPGAFVTSDGGGKSGSDAPAERSAATPAIPPARAARFVLALHKLHGEEGRSVYLQFSELARLANEARLT